MQRFTLFLEKLFTIIKIQFDAQKSAFKPFLVCKSTHSFAFVRVEIFGNMGKKLCKTYGNLGMEKFEIENSFIIFPYS